MLQIALHFVQDKNTRFDLAIECGNLEVALETAEAIDRPEFWSRLAQQALKQGNHKVSYNCWRRATPTSSDLEISKDRRKGLPTDEKL